MDLFKIAEAEETCVQQLFVRASRIFPNVANNPTGDYERWTQGGAVPNYIKEYARYWEGLNRTDTHRSRGRN